MLFETRGLNKTRLVTLQKYYKERKVLGQLQLLIENDSLFQTDPLLAYSISWGLANYLSETNPKAFFAYLKEDSKRQNFRANPPPARLKAFAKHFGHDINELENKMERFYH